MTITRAIQRARQSTRRLLRNPKTPLTKPGHIQQRPPSRLIQNPAATPTRKEIPHSRRLHLRHGVRRLHESDRLELVAYRRSHVGRELGVEVFDQGFAAFGEFTRREAVIERADDVVENFDQLRDLILESITATFSTMESSSIMGITVLGEISMVNRGTASREKPNPVMPCSMAAKK